MDYAKAHDLPSPVHFTDDGISGTRFDRPGFMAMMDAVNDGTVGTICIKDMSRMGRDYLKVGQVMEMLRQKGVRLIAINDGVDTFKGDDDFTPFRNIMNEWYARDTSKKIKSVFKANGKSGKHVASTCPYGYLKDENDSNHWIIDEEAIVRRIFRRTIEGIRSQVCLSRIRSRSPEFIWPSSDRACIRPQRSKIPIIGVHLLSFLFSENKSTSVTP